MGDSLTMRSLLSMFLVLATLGMDASLSRADAAAPGCGQAQVERLLGAPAPPGPSAHYIEPRGAVTPFYLYEYDLPTLTGADTGTAAKLPIPTEDFNAHRKRASYATSFKAAATTHRTPPLIRSSDQIVAFRAVPADAP